MADQSEDLICEVRDGVARITFNRPEARNALTQGMVVAMTEFLRECERREDVRVVLLSGNGEHFMAGGDIKGFAASYGLDPAQRRSQFENLALDNLPLFSVMERLAKPIVAKVRGACAGASVGYAAAADFVLVSDTAVFMVANVSIGTSPDGGASWHLPRAVGLRKAKQLCLLGERLTAQEAVECGLANWLHTDEELDAETEKLLARLANGPTVAIGQARALLNQALGNDLVTQLGLEAQAAGISGSTDDFAEGLSSFLEKRSPKFRGR